MPKAACRSSPGRCGPTPTASSWQRWAEPDGDDVGELQDSWLRTQQFQGGEPGQLRALERPAAWQVYFYRAASLGQLPVDRRRDAAPTAPVRRQISAPTSAPDVPRGVRIVLSFAPGSGHNGSLIRDDLVAP